MPPRPTPADVLATLLRSDPGRPRLTCYDDATGERIELSAKTLANWVAKAANLLTEDADAGPGTRVGLDLPGHWRAAYWAWATWSVGATLVTGPGAAQAEIVVTDSADRAAATTAAGRYAVLVTLAALARSHPAAPAGAVDEAKDLAAYGDRFDPWQRPGPADPALDADGEHTAYGLIVPDPQWPAGTRVLVTGDLTAMLGALLHAWAVDGSVVLVRNALGDQAARLAAERVTMRWP